MPPFAQKPIHYQKFIVHLIKLLYSNPIGMPYNKTRKETRCAADARLKEGWSPYETLPVAAANDAQPVPGFHAVYLAVQIFISAFAARRSVFFDFSLSSHVRRYHLL